MPLKKQFVFGFFLFITLLLVAIHWNVLKSDPLLDYDDSYVVAPLQKVESVKEYIALFKAKKIYDVQPLRDLSFWLDFKLQKILPFGVHHAHNLVLWLGILFIFFRVMLFFEIPLPINVGLVLLYATHPALTNALVWVTARKHLLSTFFILWASLLVLKKSADKFRTQDVAGISLLYLLACLSQPINILWPFWVLIFFLLKQPKEKNRTHLAGVLIFIFIALALINQYYYSTIYVQQSENLKYVSANENQLSFRLLLFGRSIWQALVPFWSTPLYYYPGSLLNILGIALFSSITWWVLSVKNFAKQSWLFFSVLPVLVITINLTVVFGSDTYILNTVAGLYLIIGLTFKEHWVRFEKKSQRYFVGSIGGIIFISFIYLSHQVSQAWESDLAQTTRAMKVEPSPVVMAFHIQNLMKEKDYSNAFTYSQSLMEWDPNFRSVAQLYSSSLYQNPEIKREMKIKILNEMLKNYSNSVWVKYFLASLYAEVENFTAAQELMDSVAAVDFGQFKSEAPLVVADFYYFHYKSNKQKAIFEKKLLLIKSALGEKWNQSQYLERLRTLQVL